jgi:hypothetical protein
VRYGDPCPPRRSDALTSAAFRAGRCRLGASQSDLPPHTPAAAAPERLERLSGCERSSAAAPSRACRRASSRSGAARATTGGRSTDVGLSGPQGLSCRSILMVDRSFLRALGSPGWGLARWGVGRVPARRSSFRKTSSGGRTTFGRPGRLTNVCFPVRRASRCAAARPPARVGPPAPASGHLAACAAHRHRGSGPAGGRSLGVCASSVMRFRAPTRLHPRSGMTHA